MDFWNQFLWVIFPYMVITTYVVGHIYRYYTDQMGWTAKSSEFLEKDILKWGSMLFHLGILMVFAGHVAGLLVPKSFLESMGVSDEMYHAGAVYGGGVAGLMTLAGIVILCYRRLKIPRIRVTSDFSDELVAGLLLVAIVLGVYNTLVFNLFVGGFDYRETIGPWTRGLLTLRPDPSLMKDVPPLFKVHIIVSMIIFGIWPFTRLVHAWSVPVAYFKRSYIVYRSRNVKRTSLTSEPQTGADVRGLD